jgi:hypothetical protein
MQERRHLVRLEGLEQLGESGELGILGTLGKPGKPGIQGQRELGEPKGLATIDNQQMIEDETFSCWTYAIAKSTAMSESSISESKRSEWSSESWSN